MLIVLLIDYEPIKTIVLLINKSYKQIFMKYLINSLLIKPVIEYVKIFFDFGKS